MSDDGDSNGSSYGSTIIGGIHKAGGIILVDGRYLAMIRGRWSGKWGVPKGTLDSLDQSVLLGALREIQEETGIRLEVKKDKSVDYWMVYKCRLYLFHLDSMVPIKPEDTVEIMDSLWLDLQDKEMVNCIYEESTKMTKNVLRRLRRLLSK